MGERSRAAGTTTIRSEHGTVWAVLRRPGFLLSSWPWRALGYTAVSVLRAIALVPLIVLALPLAPALAVGFGNAERGRGRILGYGRIPPAHAPPPHEGVRAWLALRYGESATWRDTAAMMIAIAVSAFQLVVLLFPVALLSLALSLPGGLAFYQEQSTRPGTPLPPEIPLPGGATIPITDVSGVVLVFAVTALSWVVAAYVGTFLAFTEARLLRMLLSPSAEDALEAQVEDLRRSRSALTTAVDAQRADIARSLHDGVQQRLVAAAVLVGTAELEAGEMRAAGTETRALDTALGRAHEAIDLALADLRTAVRGIHPTILVDHGLVEAIRDLARSFPLPLTLSLDLDERVAATAEACAFYTVSEALTNIARHAEARSAAIDVQRDGEDLVVTISDDGVGGADGANGTGLTGLEARAGSVGGTLALSSPVGGPTRLVLTVPAFPTGDRGAQALRREGGFPPAP